MDTCVRVDLTSGSRIVGWTHTTVGAHQLGAVSIDARIRIAIVDQTLTLESSITDVACTCVALTRSIKTQIFKGLISQKRLIN